MVQEVDDKGRKMIKTSLPYDIAMMSTIAQEGAIVDMSRINFPGIAQEEQIRTAFIFMRNTGFNVTLDFSNCTKEQKDAILKEYITTDIEWYSEDICNLWLDMIEDYIQGKKTANDDLAEESVNLLASLPIYIFYRHELNNVAFSIDDIERKKNSLLGANYLSLLKAEDVSHFILIACSLDKPYFWEEIFKEDNNKLMEILVNSKAGICQLMHAFCTETPDEFSEDMEKIDAAYEAIVCNEAGDLRED